MQITILPFEDANLSDCQYLAKQLRKVFSYVTLAPKVELPEQAYNSSRHQYDADILLNIVERNSDGMVLGITSKDIYSKKMNFVFGIAIEAGNSALISLNRLHEGVNVVGYYNRVLKEALHEIGHGYGLSHCENPLCVMHYSNSLLEVDHKDSYYCDSCLSKLPSDLQRFFPE